MLDLSEFDALDADQKSQLGIDPTIGFSSVRDDFEDYNRWDAAKRGFQNESLLYMAYDNVFGRELGQDNTKDDEFNLASDEWADKTSQLSPDANDYFYSFEPQNEDMANAAYDRAAEFDRQQEYLHSLGFEGGIYRAAGALTDLAPAAALSVQTAGGSLGLWAARTNKILTSTFARRTVAGGTLEGLMELGRRELSLEERTNLDMILAVGLGGLSTGVFGRQYDKMMVASSKQLLDDAAKAAKEGRVLNYKDQLESLKARALDDQNLKSVVNKVQYDLESLTRQSASSTFRALGDQLYYGRELDKIASGEVKLEETKDLLEQNLYNLVTDATRPVMAEIGNLAKKGIFKTTRTHFDPQMQHTINQMFGEVQLEKLFSPELSIDDLVGLTADKLVAAFDIPIQEAHRLAKNMVSGAEKVSNDSYDILRKGGSKSFVEGRIPQTKDYMPVVHDTMKVAELVQTHGKREVVNFFEKAINSALKKRDIAIKYGAKGATPVSRTIARSLVSKLLRETDPTVIMKMDKDSVAEMLAGLDIPDEVVDQVAAAFKPAAKAEGSKFEKTRGIFDYAARHTTKAGKELSFRDILSSDFEAVWFPYARTQAGSNTLEKLGLDTQKALNETRTKIENELKQGGLDTKKIDAEMARFDETILELQGRPLLKNPYGTGAQVTRTVKNMNIARYLGGTFWSMTAEMNNVMWHTGLPHFIKTVPTMKSLLKQFKTGKLDDEVLQELYDTFGLMGDMNRGIGFSRFEHDYATVPLAGGKRWLNKTEQVSDQFKEAALIMGGIKPLTAFFESSTATGLIKQVRKAAELSAKGKKLPKRLDVHLNEMGISGEMRDRVFAEMKKHTTFTDDTIFGKGLKKINVEQWDPEVGDAFIAGVKRLTNTVVQRATLGDKVGFQVGGKLLENTIGGKLALDMKGYVLLAWRKQLGRALARRDLFMASMLASQMALTAVSYMAQVYVNYPTDKKKREELLTMDKIIKASFARSSVSSWLPQLIDTGARSRLYDPVFSHTRSSGLSSDAVNSIPAVDLFNSMSNLPSIPAAMLGYGDVSPADLKSGLRFAPLHNVVGMRSLMEEAVSGYKSSRKRKKELDRLRGL